MALHVLSHRSRSLLTARTLDRVASHLYTIKEELTDADSEIANDDGDVLEEETGNEVDNATKPGHLYVRDAIWKPDVWIPGERLIACVAQECRTASVHQQLDTSMKFIKTPLPEGVSFHDGTETQSYIANTNSDRAWELVGSPTTWDLFALGEDVSHILNQEEREMTAIMLSHVERLLNPLMDGMGAGGLALVMGAERLVPCRRV